MVVLTVKGLICILSTLIISINSLWDKQWTMYDIDYMSIAVFSQLQLYSLSNSPKESLLFYSLPHIVSNIHKFMI